MINYTNINPQIRKPLLPPVQTAAAEHDIVQKKNTQDTTNTIVIVKTGLQYPRIVKAAAAAANGSISNLTHPQLFLREASD